MAAFQYWQSQEPSDIGSASSLRLFHPWQTGLHFSAVRGKWEHRRALCKQCSLWTRNWGHLSFWLFWRRCQESEFMLSGLLNCAGKQRTLAASFATIYSYFQEEDCSFRFFSSNGSNNVTAWIKKTNCGSERRKQFPFVNKEIFHFFFLKCTVTVF